MLASLAEFVIRGVRVAASSAPDILICISNEEQPAPTRFPLITTSTYCIFITNCNLILEAQLIKHY